MFNPRSIDKYVVNSISLMSNDAIAQKAIRGTVLDEANEPIIGASVLVKGTTNGSITGVDGSFNVKANPSDVLVISYVGYATVEQQVGNQTQLVIHLREDSKVLNDVVVIGYGSTTKKELTGSVTSMKKDDLNPGTFTNAMGMLQGKVAGLQIINRTVLIRQPNMKYYFAEQTHFPQAKVH